MDFAKKFGSPPQSMKAPASAADVSDDWCDKVREILRRDGYAVRGRSDTVMIEVKSLTTNAWHSLSLPTGATSFISLGDRDIVLAKITRE